MDHPARCACLWCRGSGAVAEPAPGPAVSIPKRAIPKRGEGQDMKVLGQLGGRSRSEQKGEAARVNGKRGGWPKGRARR